MKALTTFIAIALLAFSTTACSQQHTYRSGGFGSKTVKASKNYVTKDIKVNNFTKLSVADECSACAENRHKSVRPLSWFTSPFSYH